MQKSPINIRMDISNNAMVTTMECSKGMSGHEQPRLISSTMVFVCRNGRNQPYVKFITGINSEHLCPQVLTKSSTSKNLNEVFS